MVYFTNGKVGVNSINELFSELFMEIGLYINANNYLCDQDTMNPLLYNEKYIKVSLNGIPVYAGKTDIIFDPAHNYGLMSKLFGYYLDKAQNSEDGDILQGYIANFVDDNETKDKQRVTVRTKGRGDIYSNFYYNIYLAYIDCIFQIGGYNNIDLSNLDIIEEIK